MENKKPRVAYIIADAQLCGGLAVVCQHANRMARRGFDTCIVSTAGCDKIEWFPGQNVPVYPLSRIPGDIDVGIATWWETTHDLFRLPIPRKIYFVQSDETRFYGDNRYERIFARESYHFDFEFMTEARWIQNWLKDNFGKEARYIPNGIDRELFHPAEPLAPKGRRPRVLIEGPADMPSKGVAEAFEAVKGLDAEIWYVNYRGKPDPAWKPDRYFYSVPMTEMKRIYSSCDILLKLSVVEGAFGPPLEMMACGGTCVSAEVTGLDETIVPGENALVVERGDIKGAGEAVKKLMSDPALRGRLIKAGKATVEKLDWEKSIDRLESFLLSKAPRNPESSIPRRSHDEILIETYALVKKAERDANKQIKSAWKTVAKMEDDLRRLQHAINLKQDELNSIYSSKAWKLACAIKEARHSLIALLKLPLHMIKSMF